MNLDVIQKIDRIHSYPAKFPVELALNYIEEYTKPGDIVYDPFMGSGTTLLASALLNRFGYGTDINHIAVLISQFKLLILSDEEISFLQAFIDDFESTYAIEAENTVPFFYPSVDHWFCENSKIILTVIKNRIEKLIDLKLQIFCKLVMSAVINTVSNQESDTRYAAIEKPNLTKEKVATTFIKKFNSILQIFTVFNGEPRLDLFGNAFFLDSKECASFIKKESVSLILTSPPYVNTYDYYLYHKHRMNWLGFDVKYSMETEIGSRREFSSLKHEAQKFSDDLYTIFLACNSCLKPGGHAVIVIGDGKVAGEMYDAKENTIIIGEKLGWRPIDYSFSLLDQTSRSFQKAYRTQGKKEHILVFEKG